MEFGFGHQAPQKAIYKVGILTDAMVDNGFERVLPLAEDGQVHRGDDGRELLDSTICMYILVVHLMFFSIIFLERHSYHAASDQTSL